MKLIEEFKAFAVRGNIVDLAVAVIIGTAFGKITSSLVDTVVMPVVGLFLGELILPDGHLSWGTRRLRTENSFRQW